MFGFFIPKIMSDPVFKIGDKVECEGLRSGASFTVSPNEPRWNFYTDRGGSGEYIQGIVTLVDSVDSYVRVKLDNINLNWKWPLLGHHKYDENQWERPGYLRHVGSVIGSTIRHPGKWRLVSKGSYTTLEKVK